MSEPGDGRFEAMVAAMQAQDRPMHEQLHDRAYAQGYAEALPYALSMTGLHCMDHPTFVERRKEASHEPRHPRRAGSGG